MVDRIYPGKLINPNTPLGYDGADYRVPHIDKQSDGDHALRVSTILDRLPTNVSISCSAQYGNHNLTQRASYTVPAGKRAVLLACFAFIEVPGSTGFGEIRITVGGLQIFRHNVNNGLQQWHTTRDQGYELYLPSGITVALSTGNSSTSTIWMQGTAYIIEFDA